MNDEAAVERTRLEWEEGYRRLEGLAGDAGLYRRVLDELDVVTDELRRRVGETFTLEQLVLAYGEADRWSREALADRGSHDAHRRAAMVEDAAFHRYSRGAVDYRP
ncbi:MAG: hypothetical protein ICV59_00705 [Thermoleophilia bacterium]|nr:hypothetical protein [Thermoleophilia bacterium]